MPSPHWLLSWQRGRAEASDWWGESLADYKTLVSSNFFSPELSPLFHRGCCLAWQLAESSGGFAVTASGHLVDCTVSACEGRPEQTQQLPPASLLCVWMTSAPQ